MGWKTAGEHSSSIRAVAESRSAVEKLFNRNPAYLGK
jgi:hypothetical protein